jgi:hypothetical protein
MSPFVSGCYSSTSGILVSCSFLTLCLCSFSCFHHGYDIYCTSSLYITNFMGHDLAIIVVQNFFFIGSNKIDTNVIHLLVLFEHQCCVHCFDMNVIYLFILFRHTCYMSICVVYTQKLCTWLPCLNNAWHSCLNDMHPWNNKFRTNLERTHEAYIFVMCLPTYTNVGIYKWCHYAPHHLLSPCFYVLLFFLNSWSWNSTFLNFVFPLESTSWRFCCNLPSFLRCCLHLLSSSLDLDLWFLWSPLLVNK